MWFGDAGAGVRGVFRRVDSPFDLAWSVCGKQLGLEGAISAPLRMAVVFLALAILAGYYLTGVSRLSFVWRLL
jgi:hypothetical protein